MALFDDVFNRATFYDMLFFNVKAVLIHPTLNELKIYNKPLYERWKYLSKSKYNVEIDGSNFDEGGLPTKQEEVYEENASYYPEFTKIVAITYCKLHPENGVPVREFKKIGNLDEALVIATFMDELNQISSDGSKSTPQVFPILCGFNIISYDIPLLIKRFIINRSKLDKKTLPYILKRALNIKPWESGVIDGINVWKFNGNDNLPLMLIADFMGLKKTVDLLPLPELSKYYHENIQSKPAETIDFMTLQSATQTNLMIQLINELRQI